MKNFFRVKELVDTGKLEIISIISPVRTVSSITSRCFSGHPQIDTECLQPFHLKYSTPYNPPTDREEDGYALILENYQKAAAKKDTGKIRIVVKEMARNISTGEQLIRWSSLTKNPLVTIRNPILSIESLIRQGVQSFFEAMPEAFYELARSFAERNGHQASNEYLEKFLNIYAKHHGFIDSTGLGQHFKVMTKHALQTKDYRVLGELLLAFEPYEDLNNRLLYMKRHYVETMDDSTAKLAGYENLNDFAKKKGKQNWKEIKKNALDSNDFSEVQPLLDVVFSTSISGWFNIGKITDAIEEYCVIEVSLMRTDPNGILSQACEYIGLDGSHVDAMINFAPNSRESGTRHMEAHYIAAQSRIHGSEKLELPTEVPAAFEKFPLHFQQHILEVALPAYIFLLSHDKCLRPHDRKGVETLLHKKVTPEGVTLMQIDPVMAYALISTSKSIPRQERAQMLEALMNERKREFGPVMEKISQLASIVSLATPDKRIVER